MKLLCVVLLQLLSFAAIAGGASSSMVVSVTVVRSAPVTTLIDVNGKVTTRPGDVTQQPITTTTTQGGIQYIFVDY